MRDPATLQAFGPALKFQAHALLRDSDSDSGIEERRAWTQRPASLKTQRETERLLAKQGPPGHPLHRNVGPRP